MLSEQRVGIRLCTHDIAYLDFLDSWVLNLVRWLSFNPETSSSFYPDFERKVAIFCAALNPH